MYLVFQKVILLTSFCELVLHEEIIFLLRFFVSKGMYSYVLWQGIECRVLGAQNMSLRFFGLFPHF